MPPVRDRYIFHFTDHSNLAGIIADGGLHCDSTMAAGGRPFTECANEGIKSGRRTRLVDADPFGVIADYVPFYYAARSPMMSAISHHQVAGYTSNGNLVYLVSTLSSVDSSSGRWVCSNGNARALISDFYNSWEELEANTDWGIMNERYWGNTEEDGDRKRRRAAEFLVHKFFPIDLVRGIIVKSAEVAGIVTELLPGTEVKIGPDHYI